VDRVRSFLENQIFHARVRVFLAGLTEQYHQDNPLDLFDVDIRGLKGQKPIDEEFPLRWRQDSDLLEVNNIPTTIRIEALVLEVIVYASAVRG
jgi:hypothetical protein